MRWSKLDPFFVHAGASTISDIFFSACANVYYAVTHKQEGCMVTTIGSVSSWIAAAMLRRECQRGVWLDLSKQDADGHSSFGLLLLAQQMLNERLTLYRAYRKVRCASTALRTKRWKKVMRLSKMKSTDSQNSNDHVSQSGDHQTQKSSARVNKEDTNKPSERLEKKMRIHADKHGLQKLLKELKEDTDKYHPESRKELEKRFAAELSLSDEVAKVLTLGNVQVHSPPRIETEANGTAVRVVHQVQLRILCHAADAAVRISNDLHPTSGPKRLFYPAAAVASFVTYYFDLWTDYVVIKSFYTGGHPVFFVASICCIMLNLVATCTFDMLPYLRIMNYQKSGQSSHQKAKSSHQKHATSQSCIHAAWNAAHTPDSRGELIFKLLQNITMTRMLFETRRAFNFISAGYKPPPCYDGVKIAEGFFEGVPQSFLQCYAMLTTFYAGEMPSFALTSSVLLSFFSVGCSITSLGRMPSNVWRALFFVFAVIQVRS